MSLFRKPNKCSHTLRFIQRKIYRYYQKCIFWDTSGNPVYQVPGAHTSRAQVPVHGNNTHVETHLATPAPHPAMDTPISLGNSGFSLENGKS